MEPLAVTMVELLLGWSPEKSERVREATALLFPERDGKFHVFHKTVVDWLTGEVSNGSSVSAQSEEFNVRRHLGHRSLANGFLAWLETVELNDVKLDEVTLYWLRHGIVHLCRSTESELAAKAAQIYATNLVLLKLRLNNGLLKTLATDFLELQRCLNTNELKDALQMKVFVGKYRDVLQRERGDAVMQLAFQQPDDSVVFQSLGHTSDRLLKWRNKPQEADPCITTFAHSSAVCALAVTQKYIVSGAGQNVYVYDALTEELVEELEGKSNVLSVAMTEQNDGGLLVAGYVDGTIKVWDAGAFVTSCVLLAF